MNDFAVNLLGLFAASAAGAIGVYVGMAIERSRQIALSQRRLRMEISNLVDRL